MMFRSLKPFLFLATIAILGMACKEAPSSTDETPFEQKANSIVPQKKVSEEVVLNPAHGEPGHRCDIPVGKPLNSKPEKKLSGNLNPAHGQPGHRCDLPVGAPLPE